MKYIKKKKKEILRRKHFDLCHIKSYSTAVLECFFLLLIYFTYTLKICEIIVSCRRDYLNISQFFEYYIQSAN